MFSSHAVVFDFDGTLMPKEFISLFNVMDCALGEVHRKEIENLRIKYIPKILSRQITPEEDMIMVTRPAQIYIESRLTICQMKKAIAKVNLRQGVTKTLQFLYEQKIPVAIISYSYLQAIELTLTKHGIGHLVSKVYGANLVFKNGIVCGYRPETFVFSKNKGLFSRQFAKRYDIPDKNILAVGDSGADCYLGHLKENRLGLAQDEAEKEKIQKFFGEVVVTENFDPVLEWLKMKINP